MKPLILITNDDGIYSPGLHAAAEAVSDLGELLIAAPHCQQTSMGRAFPRTEDLGIIETTSLMIHGKSTKAYAVHGSPAYAVAHAVLEIAGRKPDLCISGINYGENLGMVATCSGTLGAAFEANSHGIPAIASSLQTPISLQRKTDYGPADWSAASVITRRTTEFVLKKGMPEGASIFNINVPEKPKYLQNYHITRQSHQNYFDFIRPEQRDFSKRFELKSRLYVDLDTLEPDSDIYAVYIEKVISVTPMTWDMTARVF
ncbi:5'/3'-nucleotidase SurE [Caproiciproducens galactitolivorans]|uniref:5'-nucleotidase n=1 Tax=Caproiciproducens galactitolivorans TaxID=642589 RepID=A0ABT4BSE0_9FIRM|nr:5'/3'-nucleotidase SurE [Caproiciproducens galactitolivorans]MCY1712856.1 5'/3'-nucleotidase SurE [Caproiciproducens galactitolivorans]